MTLTLRGSLRPAGFAFNPAEESVRVTVAWQATADHLPEYTVFVQLLEADTDIRVAGVDTQPGRGTWPTSRWVQNEVVVDDYVVTIPPDLAPGNYKVIVGLYHTTTGERLRLTTGADYWLLPQAFIWKG
jgi:hypothetical protein